MKDKTILITGGTSGIGKHTAIGLAKLGAHVIVTGRDRTRGEQGVAQIKQASSSSSVELMLADLSVQAGIEQLVNDYKSRYPRLDVLINNVGLMEGERRLTADGIEATFAVNVIAPYLLTALLLDTLKASRPARVINVTGGLPSGAIDLDNLQAEKSYVGLMTYSHAKRVMMAMSAAFAKRLEGTGVALNVAYPGNAETNMSRSMQPKYLPRVLRLAWPIFSRTLYGGEDSAAKAARSSVYLASSPEVEGVSGVYFNTNSKQVAWPRAIADEATQNAILAKVQALTERRAVLV